ncbi:transglycosylase SLT domain-containing protein [Streptomyces sp. MB09-02B]|uniref:aggregation-promoting factor C-terminal-like domain-containing protein n=1 Tax=Streptomyces sp. MB09-02B TaxID=3028667 RepID=UPI0029AF9F4A|nr:transglycosylase SLT domain-containing protein [Streptomyces sp. MB09-02B]MDX3638635.1 transglycosylase SLT domain-containing protein [Streptomyces sp. MB09-02B]
MSGNLVRDFAVASAAAVTTVGAVAGVGQSGTGQAVNDAGTTASGSTLLADIPMGRQARIQTASLTQQADAQSVAADHSARTTAAEAARKQAAKDAVAKQKEAERKKARQDAKERQEAEEQAQAQEQEQAQQQAERQTEEGSSSGSSAVAPQSSYTVAQVQAIARQMVPGDQFQCFSNIVDHESGWNHKAVNPSSGAYGLVQAYPGSKMSSAGADWRTNPATQIKWGLNYMNDRYGSPCEAWAFWQANGSY